MRLLPFQLSRFVLSAVEFKILLDNKKHKQLDNLNILNHLNHIGEKPMRDIAIDILFYFLFLIILNS
jgi:hypothetical protein